MNQKVKVDIASHLPMFDEPFDPIIILVQTGDHNILGRHNEILTFLNQCVEMIVIAFVFRIAVNNIKRNTSFDGRTPWSIALAYPLSDKLLLHISV